MTAWLKQRLSNARGLFLDRLMLWSAALLVFVVVAFAIYYYVDQEGRGGAGPVEREISRYEEAVLSDPRDMGARMVLAELYHAEERYSESLEQYRAALTIEGGNALAMLGLGRGLLALGDEAEAMGEFEQVIALTEGEDIPGDLVEAAHYYMASVFLDRGRPDDAITHLEQAVAIERTDADAWHLLGAAYIENGDLEEAIFALSQAVSFVPDFAEAYEKLALAYERKGLIAESWYARGMLAFSQGRYSEAEEDLVAALDASATLVDAHVGLGLVRESQGQRELAVSSYQQALELDPDNFNAWAGLGRLGVALPLGASP